MMRICFTLGWIASAISLSAAGAEGQPDRRMTSVVRADLRTGKLIRSVLVTPQRLSPASEQDLQPSPEIVLAVNRIAAEHALPPALIHSVIKVESNYNPYAISSKGALGLMQLIPATARRFGVSDVFNPVENIQGGAKYLKYLLGLYNGDYGRTLAAYNAGEEAVARYGGVPPFPETQNYVILVRKRFEQRSRDFAKQQKVLASRPVEDPPGAPRHIQEIAEADGSVRYVSR